MHNLHSEFGAEGGLILASMYLASTSEVDFVFSRYRPGICAFSRILFPSAFCIFLRGLSISILIALGGILGVWRGPGCSLVPSFPGKCGTPDTSSNTRHSGLKFKRNITKTARTRR